MRIYQNYLDEIYFISVLNLISWVKSPIFWGSHPQTVVLYDVGFKEYVSLSVINVLFLLNAECLMNKTTH